LTYDVWLPVDEVDQD